MLVKVREANITENNPRGCTSRRVVILKRIVFTLSIFLDTYINNIYGELAQWESNGFASHRLSVRARYSPPYSRLLMKLEIMRSYEVRFTGSSPVQSTTLCITGVNGNTSAFQAEFEGSNPS